MDNIDAIKYYAEDSMDVNSPITNHIPPITDRYFNIDNNEEWIECAEIRSNSESDVEDEEVYHDRTNGHPMELCSCFPSRGRYINDFEQEFQGLQSPRCAGLSYLIEKMRSVTHTCIV